MRCLPHLRGPLSRLLLSLLCALSPPVSAATDYFRDAQQWQQSGDTRAAIIQLKNLLQAEPDHAEGRLLLGQLYLEQDRYTEAEKELSQARQLQIASVRVAPALAEALVGTQRYDEALTLLLTVWGGDQPDQARRWALIGSARFGQRRLEEAENAFYRSIQSGANDLAQLGLALVAQAHGRFDEALEHLRPITGDSREARRATLLRAELLRARHQFAAAIDYYNQILEDTPDNLSARLGRAQEALELRHTEQADGDIAYLLKKAPEALQVRILAALGALAHQRYNEAIEHTQMVLQAQPTNPQGLLLAGTAYYHLEQLDKAAGSLRALLDVQPTHLVGNRLLGATLIRQKQPQQALELLQPWLSKGVTDPVLRTLAGTAYLMTGELETGEQLLLDSMERLPDDRSLINQVALSRALSGRGEEALTLLDDDSSDPTVKSDAIRVVAMLRADDQPGALKLLLQRVEAQPEQLQYRMMLGLLQLRSGQFDDASQTFTAASTVAPENPAPLMGLARTAWQQRQWDQAETYFKQVLDAHPQHLSARLGMAAVSERRQDEAAMAEHLKLARQQHPNAFAPVKLLVNQLLTQGQQERALAESHNFYLDHPQQLEALLLYAALLKSNAQYQAAVELLQPRYEENPSQLRVAMALAENLKGAGRWQPALAITRPLVERHGPLTAAGLLDTELLILTGALPQADAQWQQQWQHQQSAALARLKVVLALRQGELKTAWQFVERLYPQQHDPQLLQLMMQIQLRLVGPAAVEQLLNRHLQQFPDDPFALLQAAALAHQQGQLQVAIARYETLKEHQPQNPIPWNNLAWLYQQQDDPRSLTNAREANRLAPDSADIQDTLGWMLLRHGDKREALKVLDRAAKALPDNAEVQLHRAQALVDNDRVEDARPLLQVLADGESKVRSEAAALLERLK